MTHILFTAEAFLARLTALVPRPPHTLTRFHDVFALDLSPLRGIAPGD